MTTFNGNYDGKGLKIGIVVARFNDFLTSRLVTGAQDMLLQHGVRADDIDIVWVPGAFEIPLMAQKLAKSGRYDGLITLGAVIRGETAHFDYICSGVTQGVAQVELETGVPTMFGVLTTENLDQAINRAGVKSGNKGADCALGVLEMVSLNTKLNRI